MPRTKDQQSVIDTKQINLIVSAGAGSGKTSTLTDRVIDIIKNGLSIKNLLVLILKLSIMNKAQLIDAIAEKAGLTKADSKKALEAFVATIGESLKKDEKVALVGFGSFSVSERSARAGRNPQTGKTIQIPDLWPDPQTADSRPYQWPECCRKYRDPCQADCKEG